MRTKCIIFGGTLRIRVKKFIQNLPENYSKSTKIAITACKFSNFFRGSLPPDPLKCFLFLNQLQICSTKNVLEKKWKWCPPSFKIFRYATDGKFSLFFANSKNFSIYSNLLLGGYYRLTICRPHKFWMKPLRWKVCSSLAKRDVYNQWWDSAGSHRFYRTVSGNFIRTANRLALLLILVSLVETELDDNI